MVNKFTNADIIILMNKNDRAELFRQRLQDAMQRTGTSRSELARAASVDRSTIASLLNEQECRLPNAHLAAECASKLQVSSDWLLGLTDRSELSAELLSAQCELTDAQRTPADEQLVQWHKEAAGYKIRHVPATFPDILKTDAVLDFEYASFIDKSAAQAQNASRETNHWLQAPGSDYEICMPLHQIDSMIQGVGYWAGLSTTARRLQARHFIEQSEQRYPSLRTYLCDYKRIYSAPLSVFGPLLAVVYVGRQYLVFRERRQVQALTEHFDSCVRYADVDARSVPAYVQLQMEKSGL